MTATHPGEPAVSPAPPAGPTDSELGRHLLTLRGLHQVHAAIGDPLAALLCGEPEDTGPATARLLAEPLQRSASGTWVCADPALVADLLDDDRLDTRHPDDPDVTSHATEDLWESGRTCHVTPRDGACLDLPRAEAVRLTAVADDVLLAPQRARRAELGALVAETLDRAGRTPGCDIVDDLVRPAVHALTSALLGPPAEAACELRRLTPWLGGALDAGLAPPRLPHARSMQQALARLPAVLAGSELRAACAAGPVGPVDAGVLATLQAVAGAEIATVAVTNAVRMLADRPQRWAALAADPARAAVELDAAPPPVRLTGRIVARPFRTAGQEMAADDHVVLVLDAAGRAGSAVPAGSAEAVVAGTARLHAELVLAGIACRLPRLHPAAAPVHRIRAPVTRALLRWKTDAG